MSFPPYMCTEAQGVAARRAHLIRLGKIAPMGVHFQAVYALCAFYGQMSRPKSGTYMVSKVHKISSQPTDKHMFEVRLPDGCMQNSKTLGAALRDVGVLYTGERVRTFRVEGDKVVVFPDRGIWHSITLEVL